jgi:hypothetical protein
LGAPAVVLAWGQLAKVLPLGVTRGDRCALIVLGGGHDLSDSVRRLAPGCEYLPVTPRAYPKAAGKP